MINIRTEENVTYTNIPSPALEKVERWLKDNDIEYKILSQDEIPADLPMTAAFKGRKEVKHVKCIQSHLNSDDLRRYIEEEIF